MQPASQAPIRPRRERHEQLPGILKVATPQHAHALASEPVGLVGRDSIVGHDDRFRWGGTAFRLPDRVAVFA
jgi:hypothetical protein